MNSFVLFVLVSFVVFTAGSDGNVDLQIFSKSIKVEDADIIIVQEFFNRCPELMLSLVQCVGEHHRNPNPVTNDENCVAARIDGKCLDKAFGTVKCVNKQGAIEASKRLESAALKEFCGDSRNASGLVSTGFLTVTIMACLNLLRL